ncbi:DNA cytosine methyltransferase [Allomesorhizobium camelthorni]|uniref:DNA (cytosine-5-)-methyltransferase n=1 Tax=Allomesorhizobium camelthorni TaxID=475069 RepID=A0A6G4W890_9HYPH|nr:DNA cytosine methyltransferase [Mesorhizobium camelthorni]NGO50453.1 C-5 cytosine-specific DNA methylase [Mesorhizobium camelthorni]
MMLDGGNRPLIVDSFAGGGGASTGIELALGRSPDIAINHSADALAMHAMNHPDTVHLDSNIWDVSPSEVCKGRHVGLLWASPDCKHFSKAKGGKPLDRNIRDLAWVVVRWAEEVRPDVILLENVEEFRTWGPIYEDGTAIAQLRGQTFQDWVKRLKKAGYKVQHRELRACDYGAPTIRKRLFLIARRDGGKIVWPKPTHGKPDDPDVIKGRKKPWRTAAEIIDWSIPCPSIFDSAEEIMAKHGVRAIRPLADATMRRIARGVVRYVLEAKKPFIVRTDMASAANRNGVQDVDAPLNTLTTAGSFAIVSPVMTAAQHGGSVRGADEPLHTITASRKDQNAVIVPTFVGCGGRAGQSAPRGGDEPLGTLTAKADGCVVAPVLVETAHGEISLSGVKRWGLGIKRADEPTGTGTISGNHALAAVHLSRFTQNGVGHGADEPLDTVMAGAPKFGVVAAFLAQHNNDSRRIGGVNPGRPADEPLATLTAAGAQQQVVTAHMMRQFGTSVGHSLDEPTHTDTARVNKSALIAPFLTKYYGQGDGAAVDGPLHTDTTKDRFGLVTVEIDGQTYAIADIGMRMLTPRERFRAQGFPDSYIIDRRTDGSAITQTVQGSCCGNSVSPPLAEALAAANCSHLVEFREAAE